MKKKTKAKVRKSPAKKTASKKAKTRKKVTTQPVVSSKYKQLKDGSIRVYSWKVQHTPTVMLPEMVTVLNTKTDESRRFVDATRAIAWIEANHSETLVEKGEKVAKKELSTIGLSDAVQVLSE